MDLRTAAIAEGHGPQTGKLQRTVVPSTLEGNGERLDSWKQIAVYLDREVRTVQRWGRHEDLPVRRHRHPKGCTVYAFKSEIDGWLRSRTETPGEARTRQKSKRTPNRWNPPPDVRRMLAAFRLWLAFVEQDSYEDFEDMEVTDAGMALHDRQLFTPRPKPESKARSTTSDTSRMSSFVACRSAPCSTRLGVSRKVNERDDES